MKPWSEDHPKAALLARKRADILKAARAQFLETGYANTSMQSIAKAAHVSIMTLYRHAETKDALFSAVITSACQPATAEEEAGLEKILTLQLPDVLLQSALHMQDILTSVDTIAAWSSARPGGFRIWQSWPTRDSSCALRTSWFMCSPNFPKPRH